MAQCAERSLDGRPGDLQDGRDTASAAPLVGDPVMGLYNYGARFYSTTLGRFLSVDPMVGGAGDPQSWNAYTYVRNNPLRHTDPSGMCIPDVNCPKGVDAGAKKREAAHTPAGCNLKCLQWKAAARAYQQAAHNEAMRQGMLAGKALNDAAAAKSAAKAPDQESSLLSGLKGLGKKAMGVEKAVEQVGVSVVSEIPYAYYYGSYRTLQGVNQLPLAAQTPFLPIRPALWVAEGGGLGATEALDRYRKWRFGRDTSEGRYGPPWGNVVDGYLQKIPFMPEIDIYLPGVHNDGSVDWQW